MSFLQERLEADSTKVVDVVLNDGAIFALLENGEGIVWGLHSRGGKIPNELELKNLKKDSTLR